MLTAEAETRCAIGDPQPDIGQTFAPTAPAILTSMDEVIIKGTKYISSKRAAKESGYAKDYIGQLVRMGKLPAIKVGRSWFVEERGVLTQQSSTRLSDGSEKGVGHTITLHQPRQISQNQLAVAAVNFPATWSQIKYLVDEKPLFPGSDSRETNILKHENHSYTGTQSELTPTRVPVRINVPKTAVAPSGISVSIDGVRVISEHYGAYAPQSGQNEPPTLVAGSTGGKSGLTRFDKFARVTVAALIVSFIVFLIPNFV